MKYFKQVTDYHCGAAVAQMIYADAGAKVSQRALGKRMGTNNRVGTDIRPLLSELRKCGFVVRSGQDQTTRRASAALKRGDTIIVLYLEPEEDVSHYAILDSITPDKVTMRDPWHGPHFSMSRSEFERRWKSRMPRTRKWAVCVRQRPTIQNA